MDRNARTEANEKIVAHFAAEKWATSLVRETSREEFWSASFPPLARPEHSSSRDAFFVCAFSVCDFAGHRT